MPPTFHFRMSHLLVCFNSSTNFLIYYLNGEKFRRAWVETYGSWCDCFHRPLITAPTTNVNIQGAVPEVQLEMGCKAATGSSDSSERVDADAITAHGLLVIENRNNHSRCQNSYENTQCETLH